MADLMILEGMATIDVAGARNDDEECEASERTGTREDDPKGTPSKGGPVLGRFQMIANSGSPMKLGSWKFPVALDMEGGTIPDQRLPVRFNHSSDAGVGHTTSIGIQGGRLVAAGVISRNTAAAREIRESATNGFPWKVSVGASADEVEFIKAGMKGAVNGQELDGPVNIARRWTVGELSFVDLAADPRTDVLVAETGGLPIAAAKDGGDESDEGSKQRTAGEIIQRAKVERARKDGIAALAVEYSERRGVDLNEIDKIVAKAETEGWSINDTELALLRETRAKPVHRGNGGAPTPQVLECALCLFAGINDNTLATNRAFGYSAQIVEQAYPLRSRGLRGTIAAALEMAGRPVPYGSRELFDSILDYQRTGGIQAAGFSTINLPGILGNVANKILLEAFTLVETTYDKIADQADFSNFHVHTIYRLDHLGSFELVSNDGELKHGALAQTAYQNQLETRGQMITLSRQDIVNDDLNAFRSLTAQLARKARIAVEKALYSLVCEATNVFYTAAQGNLLTTNGLGIAALGAAEAAQYTMADAWGDPIYAISKWLLVPPQLKFLAEQIFSSNLVNDLSGGPKPTDNPFRGRFTVVSSPYLSSPLIPGSSPTTWYLLADPSLVPAFQIAYLDGRREPTVETQDAQFNTLGLQMRVYWDFGLAKIDYRGAIKNTA